MRLLVLLALMTSTYFPQAQAQIFYPQLMIDVFSAINKAGIFKGNQCDAQAKEPENPYPLYEKYKPLKCKKSKSPIFATDINDIPEIDITADFKTINQTRGNSSKGILSYKDSEGKTQHILTETSSRGNSRGSRCPWKPLRLRYYKQDLVSNFTANNPNLQTGSQDFLKKLYQKTLEHSKKMGDWKNNKIETGLFDKTGDDIKIVTHCGNGGWVGAGTPEQQDERLLTEYYLYHVIGMMKSTSLDVQLVNINYRDPEGNIIITRKGFIRESGGKLAKRCGLPNEREGDIINKVSSFQADLYNHFLMNDDYSKRGHNTEILTGANREKYIGIYDFDLSGLANPKGGDFTGHSKNNLKRFLNQFQNSDDELAIVQVNELYRKLDKMRKVVDESLLEDERKANFQKWLDYQDQVMKEYLENIQTNMPEVYTNLIPPDKRVLQMKINE